MTQRNPLLLRARYFGACAALAASTGILPGPSAYAASAAPGAAPSSAQRQPDAPRMTELIGANGWPTSSEDFRFWQDMGLTWGRDSVGPGRADSRTSPLDIDKTGPGYNTALPPIILNNNRHGIKSLIFLGYTPAWNAAVAGDSNSAPKDEHYWQEYVEAVVKKYSAPPYNVKYFQIWNEAAGPLSGGSAQATFWHGPRDGSDPRHERPYANAMEDYVNLIHIPAARIIHKYHAYVVYGGWPDQGGMDNYIKWLEYESPVEHARMLDYVDYLDVHYLGIGDLDRLYQRYVATGKVRGVWQTEIGDTYMRDPQYLPTYFFGLAVWALDHRWDEPDKYLSMIYHWDGLESYRLTHRGPPRTYNPSGRALIALKQNVSGALAPFHHAIRFSDGASGKALYSGAKIVFQVSAKEGRRSLEVADLAAPASGHFSSAYVDAVTGAAVPDAGLSVSWQGTQLSLGFNAPGAGRDSDGKPLAAHLGYLLVTPLP
jgi:hypothetical protein